MKLCPVFLASPGKDVSVPVTTQVEVVIRAHSSPANLKGKSVNRNLRLFLRRHSKIKIIIKPNFQQPYPKLKKVSTKLTTNLQLLMPILWRFHQFI